MVNIGKEFPDVAFQNPARFGVILADLVSKLPKSIKRPMRPFLNLARIGIGDEDFGKKRI